MKITPQSTPTTNTTIVEQLKTQFQNSHDFFYLQHNVHNNLIEIIYIESIINKSHLEWYILPKLIEPTQIPINELLPTLFQAKKVANVSLADINSLLFSGNVLFHVSLNEFYSISLADFPKRQPEESSLETSIRGPKDGFVEDIKTNISLIRRRLNTPSLCVENYIFGH